MITDERFFRIYQEFDQIYISAQVLSDEAGDIGERPFVVFLFIGFILNYFDQKVGNQCAPKLDFNGILIVTQEITQLEVLLDSPEKYFYLPSSFVNACNG
nr:hypothetical protein [Mucilaginibacter gotjawali]